MLPILLPFCYQFPLTGQSTAYGFAVETNGSRTQIDLLNLGVSRIIRRDNSLRR